MHPFGNLPSITGIAAPRHAGSRSPATLTAMASPPHAFRRISISALALIALAWSILAPLAEAHRSTESFRDQPGVLGDSHPDAPAHLESAAIGIHPGCSTCWLQMATGTALQRPAPELPLRLLAQGTAAAPAVVAAATAAASLAPARAPPSLPASA
jgi:hypothetical protein